jgi:hypothetical protein
VIVLKQTTDLIKAAKAEDAVSLYLPFSLLMNDERYEMVVYGVIPFKQVTTAISQLVLCKCFVLTLGMKLICLKEKDQEDEEDES